jgi:3',5'-nucleoside bisphosphate phosphatase
MIDLHLHSSASDGKDSPAELVARAAAHKVALLALTDHDTLQGLPDFFAAAAEQGIEAVAGIELSAAFLESELHLLGYGVDAENQALLGLLQGIRERRDARNRRIFSRMQNLDLPSDYDSWRDRLSTPSPGRPHIADYLIDEGIVKSRREAFADYLSEGRPLFQRRDNPPLEVCIAAIRASGGLAVVAHPLSLRISRGRLLDTLPRWKEAGIAGIETIHPTANREQSLRLAQAAEKAGLLCSGGSDYHGTAGDKRFFGRTAWGTPIPDSLSIVPHLRRALGSP